MLSPCLLFQDNMKRLQHRSSHLRVLLPGSWLAPGDMLRQLHWLPVWHVQDCDYHLPVLVRKRPRLPGQWLSARRRCPCWITALLTLEHLLLVRPAAVLETGPLPSQDHKSGTVCRPISDYVGCHTASSGGYWTEDIFIRTVRPRRSVNCF